MKGAIKLIYLQQHNNGNLFNMVDLGHGGCGHEVTRGLDRMIVD